MSIFPVEISDFWICDFFIPLWYNKIDKFSVSLIVLT